MSRFGSAFLAIVLARFEMVSAKAKDGGAAFQGAVAIAPGVWLYQVTDKGLALELTAKGTKYFKDDDLN